MTHESGISGYGTPRGAWVFWLYFPMVFSFVLFLWVMSNSEASIGNAVWTILGLSVAGVVSAFMTAIAAYYWKTSRSTPSATLSKASFFLHGLTAAVAGVIILMA